MSWIADYDTQGREFPTCVHVTKTTGTMTHGATYVPIEDGKAVRAENAKLREQMERLVTLLRNDCDIEASWDGLRRFWSIELTEDGCLMRDRACKAEAENAKLRELVDGLRYCANESHGHGRCSVRFVDGYATHCPLYDEDSCTAKCEALMRELRIEVDE